MALQPTQRLLLRLLLLIAVTFGCTLAQETASFAVPDGTLPGTTIGTIAVPVGYSFRNTTNGKLTLDSNGTLRAGSETLLADTLVASNPIIWYVAAHRASDSDFVSYSIAVYVMKYDPNAPAFDTSLSLNCTIFAGRNMTGAFVLRASPTPIDYSIIGGNNDRAFALTTAPDGRTSLLTTARPPAPLAAGGSALYSLTVMAQSRTSPRRRGYAAVNVLAVSADDYQPSLVGWLDGSSVAPVYRTTAQVDIPAGVPLLRLAAVVPDAATASGASRLRYAMADNAVLSVDPITGAVSTRSALNDSFRSEPYCNQSSACSSGNVTCLATCTVPVWAVNTLNAEPGEQLTSSRAVVSVDLADAPHLSPQFVYLYEPAVNVSESASMGTFISRLTVTDPSGEASVIAGDPAGTFAFFNYSRGAFTFCHLVVNGTLDYQATPAYWLVVAIRSLSRPQLYAYRSINVTVTPAPQRWPNFTAPLYLATADAVADLPGTILSTVKAEGSQSGSVLYGIEWSSSTLSPSIGSSKSAAALFGIHPFTGDVSLRLPLPPSIAAAAAAAGAIANSSIAATGHLIAALNVSARDWKYPNLTSYVPLLIYAVPPRGVLECSSAALTSGNASGFAAAAASACVFRSLYYPALYYASVPLRCGGQEASGNGSECVLARLAYLWQNYQASGTGAGEARSPSYRIASEAGGIYSVAANGQVAISKQAAASGLQYRLTVALQAGSDAASSAVSSPSSSTLLLASVLVLIYDNLDSSVTFDQPRGYSVTVYADALTTTPARMLQLQVSASSVGGEVTYALLDGGPASSGLFAVVAGSGEIQAVVPAARLAVPGSSTVYYLTAVARRRTSLAFVNVTVTVFGTGVLLPPPAFVGGWTAALSVREDAAFGEIVYAATAVAAAGDRADVAPAIAYSMWSTSNVSSSLFSIDNTTGVVRVAAPCPGALVAMTNHSLVVVASVRSPLGGAAWSSLLLNISVIDVNDHNPAFEQKKYTVFVSESKVPGMLKQLLASDADRGENGRITYTLINELDSSRIFAILPGGYLTLVSTLDREQTTAYHLIVVATDNGTPARSTTALVDVWVTDANDNSPRFTAAAYAFAVSESSGPGVVVGQVVADDADSGRNGRVFYRVAQSGAAAHFDVDPATGVITTSALPLDREALGSSTDVVIFTVFASDEGQPPLTASVVVSVTVLDINDNAPSFGFSVLRTSVREDAAVGAPVAVFNATDADSGLNACIAYSLASPHDSAFAISGNFLVVSGPLDRSTRANYVLTVIATDAGSPVVLNKSATIAIAVIDASDGGGSSLAFTPAPPASVVVGEDMPPGYVVARLRAVSNDNIGESRETVEYRIAGDGSDGKFGIDRFAGVLYTTGWLDYESRSTYQLLVRAAILQTADDGSTNGNSTSGSCTVNITVVVGDVNEAPRFANTSYTAFISEGRSGVQVIRLSAADSDNGSSPLIYSIASISPAEDVFAVDSASGWLVVKPSAAIDRERTPAYRVVVAATDQTGKVAWTVVTITVRDANDNAPKLTSVRAAVVAAGSSVGTTIMSVTASDDDSGSNGQITYSLVRTSLNGCCSLDAASGQLTLALQLPSSATVSNFSVTVQAADRGTPSSLVQQAIDIVVLPNLSGSSGYAAGSAAIVFARSSFAAAVAESSPIGSYVVTAELAAAAAAASTVAPSSSSSPLPLSSLSTAVPTFYLIGVTAIASRSPAAAYAPSAAGGGLFSIDSTTGVVRVAGPLACAAVCGAYNLTVLAVNRGSTGPSASARVQVLVTVVADSPPAFERSAYIAFAREDCTAGETVLTVKATDHAGTNNVSYSYSTKDPTACPVVVDSSTGVVATAGELDRDATPDGTCVIQLSACNAIGCTSAVVRLNILARFAFDSSSYYFTVPLDGQADLPVGRVSLLNASAAVGFYTVTGITYSLATSWGQELFAVDAATGVVRLRAPLNQGSPARFYVVDVLATVSGDLAANTTATVYISASPDPSSFDCGLINVSVSEDAAVGSAVGMSLSSRPYAEMGSRYAYAVVSGYELAQFGLSPVDGRITTSTTLDREAAAGYSLTVIAADPLDESVTATGTVVVTVLDVNDNAPVFTSPSVVHVAENAPAPQIVATCRAYDADAGENGTVEYVIVSIVGGNVDIPPFMIDSKTGLITTTTVLDREVAATYNLTIVARDRGIPSLSTQMTIAVLVTDINDNSPQFVAQQQSSATVADDELPGAAVLVLSARDVDAGLNGAVRYYIVSGDGSEDFTLDGVSGVLTVGLSGLSYRQRREYILLVQASDLGFPTARQTNLRITVTVVPAVTPDCCPAFVDAPFYRRLVENMQPNVCLGQLVSAQPVSNTTYYRLSPANSDQWPSWMLPALVATANVTALQAIAVDSRSGALAAQQPVDREAYKQLELSAELASSGLVFASATEPLTIAVIDVNDNPPLFEVPFYAARVSEDAPVGSSILTLAAFDADTPTNANVSYSLAGFGSPFDIDPLTGTLYLAMPLDRETMDTIVLYAIASDNGMPPLTASVKVVIYVDDVNDNSPAFTGSSYTSSVATAVAAGSFLIGVTAVDPDFGANGSISYTLLPSSAGGSVDSLLQINASSGVVTASKSAAKNEGDTVVATVRAKDSGGLSSNTSIRVIFGSAATRSSGTCVYAQRPTPVTVSETAPIGSVLLTVAASSSNDGSGSGQLVYWIAGGNVGDTFNVDVDAGTLSLKRRLDYERSPSYTVWVGVTVAGNYSCLPTYVRCEVTVGDVNDSPPRFAANVVRASVVEETAPLALSPVAVLYASDDEVGPNGTVRYRLNATLSRAVAQIAAGAVAQAAAALPVPFRVDSVTGAVVVTTKLDRELVASFLLAIEAYDTGPAPLTATAFVLVTVIDVNDNEPVFAHDYAWSVSEFAAVGTIVGSVRATDADVGNNSFISYSLLLDGDSSKSFSVKPTGQVVIDRMLDRELTSAYLLTVVASNSLAAPTYNKNAKINITIIDVNDNAPVFQSPSYSFSVQSGDKRALAFIGLVSAADADGSGPNSAVRYQLRAPSAMFGVDNRTGVVFAQRPVDYVEGCINRYTVYVVASDQGVPPLNSKAASVTINVLRSPYDTASASVEWQSLRLGGGVGSQLTVPTDLPTNSSVARFTPWTRSTAILGLSSTVSGNGSDKFLVGSCGDVTLRQSLLGYQGITFQLTVTAVEAATGQQLSQATLTLPVTGPNQYSPTFDVLDDYNYTVPENASAGYMIATLRATDRDVGINGQLKYSIIDGNDLGWFDIGANDGVLRVYRTMDFAARSSCVLLIKVEDQAFRSKWATQKVVIMVATVYPKPSFSSKSYTAYLTEMSRVGTTVATVSAVCRQLTVTSPRQPAIAYAIVPQSDSAAFSIDPATGVISSAAILKYQDRPSYVITVVAFIPSSLMYNDTTTVQIGIVGINSYPPVFLQSSYEFPWPDTSANNSNASSSVRVGAVKASDFDAGPGGEVEYFLVGDSNGLGFTIELFSGVIWWSRGDSRAGAIAAAARQYAVLVVLAKNVGPLSDGRHWSSCEVEVGEARQAFAFTSSTYNVSLADDSDVGTCVLVVRTRGIASAKDVRFLLAEPAAAAADGGHFAADPLTGAVTTRVQLQAAVARREYLLVVRAVDAASSQRVLATATVAVYAFARAPSAIYFSPLQPRVSLIEGSPTPAFVINLGPMTRLPAFVPLTGTSFRYSTSDSAFTVDSSTGIVTANLLPGGRADLLLTLRVECVEPSSSCLPADLSVWITVLGRDVPPVEAYISVSVPFTASGGSSPIVIPLDLIDFASLEPWYALPSARGSNLSCSLMAQSSRTAGASASALVLSTAGCRLQLASPPTLAGDNNGVVSWTAAVRVQRPTDLATTTFNVTVTAVLFSDGGDARWITAASSSLVLFDHLSPETLVSQWLPVFLSHVAASMSSGGRTAMASNPVVVVKSLASLGPSSSAAILATAGSGASIADSTAMSSAVSAACGVLARAAGVACSSRPMPCSAASCAAATCVNAYSITQSSRPIGGWPAALVAPAGDTVAACIVCSSDLAAGNCTTAGAPTCMASLCKNGGSCRVTALSTGFSSAAVCDCKLPYFGLYCENSPWGFDDSSYAVFDGLAVSGNATSLAVVFATYSSSALLAYREESEQGRALAMQVIGGRVRLSFVADNGSVVSLSVDRTVNTGAWHRVTAGRTADGSHFLKLASCTGPTSCSDCAAANGVSSCATAAVGSSGITSLSGSARSSPATARATVSVGGLASLDLARVPADLVSAAAYRGCIAAVSIDTVDQSLSGSTAKTSGLKPGCGDLGACTSSKCSASSGAESSRADAAAAASGTCTAGVAGATCSCLDGGYLSESCSSVPGVPASLADSATVSYRRTAAYRQLAALARQSRQSASPAATVGRRRRSSLPAAGRIVSLQLRTTRPVGSLLLVNSSGGKLLIEVVDGQVSASLSGRRLPTITKTAVNDSAWHRVAVTLFTGALLVSVDGSIVQQSADVSYDYTAFDPLDPSTLEIVLAPSGGSLTGFVGCLKNFTIDGHFMPVANATTDQFVAIVTGSVSYSCPICEICATAGSCPSGDEATACSSTPAGVQQTPSPAWILPFAVVFSIVVAFGILIGLVLAYFKWKKRHRLAKKAGSPAVPRESGQLSLAQSSYDNGAFDSIGSTRPLSHVDENDFANPLAAAKDSQHRSRPAEWSGPRGVGNRTPALAAARTVPSPACDQQEDNLVIIENSIYSDGERRRDFYDLDAASLTPSESDVVTSGYYGGLSGGRGPGATTVALPDLAPTGRLRPKSAAGLGRRAPAADCQPQHGQKQRSATPGAVLDRRAAVCSPPPVADWVPQQHSLGVVRRTPIDELQLRAAAAIGAPAAAAAPHPRRTPVDELQRRTAAAAVTSGGRHSRGIHGVQDSDSSDPTITGGGCSPVAAAGRSRPGSRPLAQPRSENRTPRGRAVPHNLNRLSNRSISSESDDSSRTEPHDDCSGLGGGLRSGDRNICADDDDSTTDDTSNDSFTASEFEADTEPKIRNDQYPGGMMFTRLQEADEESDATDSALGVPESWPQQQHAVRGSGSLQQHQPVETVLLRYLPHSKSVDHAAKTGGKMESGGSTFKWDHFFSWGPNFEKLAGVFNDIAMLPSDDLVSSKIGAVPTVAGRRTPSRKEDYV